MITFREMTLPLGLQTITSQVIIIPSHSALAEHHTLSNRKWINVFLMVVELAEKLAKVHWRS